MNKKGDITLLKGNDKTHFSLIDSLKGFSITTIVLMHLLQIYITSTPLLIKEAASLGGSGVHVFILCSGFGLYFSYLKNKYSYKAFLKHRFIKIFIPYIIIVIISFLIPCMYTGSDRVFALFSHIFLFKMFAEQFVSSFGIQFWYISTLFQFYLIFIPLCKIKENVKNNKDFFLLCFCTSLIWWIFTAITSYYESRIWSSFFLQYLWEFALGIYLASLVHSGKTICISRTRLVIICICGLTIEALLALRGGWISSFNDIFAVFGYGSLAVLLCQNNEVRNIVTYISKISYEWYLTHILIFTIIYNLVPSNVNITILIAPIAFVISLIIAKLYSIYINKFIRFLMAFEHS